VSVRLTALVSRLAERGAAVIEVTAPRADGADEDPLIGDVEHDSRKVTAGSLFACIRGETTDGHGYAAAAVEAGAVALLVQQPVGLGVPEIVVADVRTMVGPTAAEVHDRPAERIDLIGVTGTNGKTTTVRLVSDVLRTRGRRVAEIGTLTGSLTTPEATELQRQFVQAIDRGDDAVAMEVSSHALDQHRVDGSRFRVAGFTNLGRDHLDHHLTVERYFAAKARLFEPDLCELAVIDIGSPYGRLLAESCTIPVVPVDIRDLDIECVGIRSSRFRWRDQIIDLPLGGAFNISNALLAAEIARALGVDDRDTADAMSKVAPVPGRFEAIEEGQSFVVLVDYAHTPDGLEAVLDAAGEVADGRVTVVFGAGGDRDREKRPRMGAIARRLADRVVVTSDNPRGEDPDTIIAAIISGMDTAPDVVEPDRRRAIGLALAGARPDDVVVIAGKGHETTQTTGSEVVEFDDRIVARQELRHSLGGRA
jgi:UDP-N-acetylmuramoyl-L-alanyl-D-glutamate--2,6-diaminopimelate ligase